MPNHSDVFHTWSIQKYNAKAISFAGTLQLFGKGQEEQHGSFRQTEEAISLSFNFRENLSTAEWCCLVWKPEANKS